MNHLIMGFLYQSPRWSSLADALVKQAYFPYDLEEPALGQV